MKVFSKELGSLNNQARSETSEEVSKITRMVYVIPERNNMKTNEKYEQGEEIWREKTDPQVDN
jgi:hypothetical protein